MPRDKHNDQLEKLKKMYPAFMTQKAFSEDGNKYLEVECRFKPGTKKIEKNKFLDLRNVQAVDDILNKTFRIQVVGKSESGKSFLVASLLNYFMNILKVYKPENVYIFSPTAKKLDKSYNCIPFLDSNIIRKFTVKKFKDLFDEYERIQLLHDENNEPREKYLIIFDDMVNQFNRHNNDLIGLFYICRHADIDILLVSQGYLSIPKSFRVQSTHSIFFNNLNNQDYKDVLGETSTPAKIVHTMYKQIQDTNYNFIFLNNTKKKPMINFDKVITYSADDY